MHSIYQPHHIIFYFDLKGKGDHVNMLVIDTFGFSATCNKLCFTYWLFYNSKALMLHLETLTTIQSGKKYVHIRLYL